MAPPEHTLNICSCCCSSSCFNFANARNVLHSQSFGSVLVFPPRLTGWRTDGPRAWFTKCQEIVDEITLSECQRLSCECIQVLFRVGTRLQVNGVVSRKPLVKFTMRTFNFVSVCVRVGFPFVAQYAECGTDIDAKASKTFICTSTTNVSLLVNGSLYRFMKKLFC